MKTRWPAHVTLLVAPMAALLCALGCSGTNVAPASGTTGITFVNYSNPATDPWPQFVAVAVANNLSNSVTVLLTKHLP